MTETEKKARIFWGKMIAFFTRNLLFFAALLLTLLIFRYVKKESEEPKSVEVRPEIQLQKGEIALGTPTPEKITVTLKGSKAFLDNITGKSVKILLHTNQAKKENNTCKWELNKKNVDVPFGTYFSSAKPSQVSLLLDETQSQKIPVQVVLDVSQLPKEFKVVNVTADPKEIIVTGPSTKVKKIQTIRTLPVPLKNITGSFDCDQGFDTKSYPDLDFDRKSVVVQVQVLPAVKTRTFNTLPIRILIPPDSKKQTLSCEIVSSPTVDIQVSGSINVIDLLRKEDIFIFANISDFTKPGLYRIDLRCAITKNGITGFKINPAEVSVKLEQIPKR